jgi:hypothetical protein
MLEHLFCGKIGSAEIGVCGFCFNARQLNIVQSNNVRSASATSAGFSNQQNGRTALIAKVAI